MDAFHQVVGPVGAKLCKDFAHFSEASILKKSIVTVEIVLPESIQRKTPHVSLPSGGDVLQLL
jgi:hypothetical protein